MKNAVRDFCGVLQLQLPVLWSLDSLTDHLAQARQFSASAFVILIMALALIGSSDLQIDGINIVRKPSTDPLKARQVFAALSNKFEWHPQVLEYLLEVMQLKTLAEFINTFNGCLNGDVDTIQTLCMQHVKEVDNRTPLQTAGVQLARVREAWKACLDAEKLGQ